MPGLMYDALTSLRLQWATCKPQKSEPCTISSCLGTFVYSGKVLSGRACGPPTQDSCMITARCAVQAGPVRGSKTAQGLRLSHRCWAARQVAGTSGMALEAAP